MKWNRYLPKILRINLFLVVLIFKLNFSITLTKSKLKTKRSYNYLNTKSFLSTKNDDIKILKQPLIIIPIPSHYCNEKWDYKNHGDNWECECKEGKYQSPIEIPALEKLEKNNCNKTVFIFSKVNGLDENKNPIRIILENTYIKIKGNMGKLTTLDFVDYQMNEIIIHIGSEHKINGIKYDMEVQLYYSAVTPGNLQKSAAVAILFKTTPGASNLFFDKDINILDLPDKYEREKEIDSEIDLNHIFMLNERDSFREFSYYQYEGSISSPPCREDTTWYVVSDPLPISFTTIETLKDSINSLNEECLSDLLMTTENLIEDPFKENTRNIQPINGRTVYFYDSPEKKNISMCKVNSNSSSGSSPNIEKQLDNYENLRKRKLFTNS